MMTDITPISLQMLLFTLVITFCFIDSFIVLKRSINAPVNEMKLLSVAIFLIAFFFIGALCVDASYFNKNFLTISILCYKICFLVGEVGLACIVLAFLIPRVTFSYRSIVFLLLFPLCCIFSGLINIFTFNIMVIETGIVVKFMLIGFYLFNLSNLLIFGHILYQIIQLSRLILGKKSLLHSNLSIVLFMLFICVLMASEMIITYLTTYALGFIAVAALFVLVYFAIAFSKDPVFFFANPAIMSSVIVIFPNSGLIAFSKNFTSEYPPEDILGSMFTALNMQLKNILQSTKQLTILGFGDKQVIMNPGKYIITLIIVSEQNFITQSISKYITKNFEKFYKTELLRILNGENIVNKEEFNGFSSIIDSIRRYLPLTKYTTTTTTDT